MLRYHYTRRQTRPVRALCICALYLLGCSTLAMVIARSQTSSRSSPPIVALLLACPKDKDMGCVKKNFSRRGQKFIQIGTVLD